MLFFVDFSSERSSASKINIVRTFFLLFFVSFSFFKDLILKINRGEYIIGSVMLIQKA